MAENSRTPREVATRQQAERPRQWQAPELLPEPDKQPGFSYRWIRVATNGQADPRNLSAKIREGWEPVRIEEQPKFGLLIDPHYQQLTDSQTRAVDNSFMRQNDPRMPLFNERKSTVSFGKGNN